MTMRYILIKLSHELDITGSLESEIKVQVGQGLRSGRFATNSNSPISPYDYLSVLWAERIGTILSGDLNKHGLQVQFHWGIRNDLSPACTAIILCPAIGPHVITYLT